MLRIELDEGFSYRIHHALMRSYGWDDGAVPLYYAIWMDIEPPRTCWCWQICMRNNLSIWFRHSKFQMIKHSVMTSVMQIQREWVRDSAKVEVIGWRAWYIDRIADLLQKYRVRKIARRPDHEEKGQIDVLWSQLVMSLLDRPWSNAEYANASAWKRDIDMHVWNYIEQT